MVRLELLDFLLPRNSQHIRIYFDDAWIDLDIVLCNETRFIAVGSLRFHLIFIFLMTIIRYFYQ